MEKTSIADMIKTDFADINSKNYFGFYDWFCKNSLLEGKAKSLCKKVKQIAGSKKFNPDTSYIFFKNNCRCFGCLYDDFRICDIETGNVIYTIVPRGPDKCGELWGNENDFIEPILTGKWTDIKNWFLKA